MRNQLLAYVFALFLLTYIPAIAQNSGSAYFDLGLFAFEEGDYPAARRHFENAVEQEPRNPRYHHYLGKTHLKLKNYKAAKEQFNAAREIDPALSGLVYDRAVADFRLEDYAAAENGFQQAAKADPENVSAWYHMGMSRFKQEKYPSAVSPFENAAELNPSILPTCRYYIGICRYKSGDTQEATRHFDYVVDNATRVKLKQYARKWLSAMDAKKEKGRVRLYQLYVKLGVQYDGNVLLEPLDEAQESDESDFVAKLYAAGRYRIGDDPRLTGDIGYAHYQTRHFDLTEYDLIGSIVSTNITYAFSTVSLGFSFVPTFYWLDYSIYLTRLQWIPEVTWRIDEKTRLGASYAYAENDYHEDDEDDGHTNTVSLIIRRRFPSLGASVFGRAAFARNDSVGPDKTYDEWGGKAGVSVQLPLRFSAGLTGGWFRKDYDNEYENTGFSRKDDKYGIAFTLSRPLPFKQTAWIFEYDYTKNDSNTDTLNYPYDREYERNTVSLSVSTNF
jgi:Tfp pilus assembly protein PilF